MRVGEHPGVDLRAAVQQQRRDDQEDHAEDQPRRARVRAEKPRPAALAVRVVPQPDHGERDDPGQHRDGEQVLKEADGLPVPDAGNRERPAEQVAVRFDDRQQQDSKAPEGQGMRHARYRPLEQLALPDHLDGLRLDVPADMLPHRFDTLRGRLPAHRQPLQPPQPAPGDRERDHSQDQTDGHPQDHANLLNIRSSSVAAQPRHDMITPAQTPSTSRAGPALTRAASLLIASSLNYLNPFFPNDLGITPNTQPSLAREPRPASPSFCRRPEPFRAPALPDAPTRPPASALAVAPSPSRRHSPPGTSAVPLGSALPGGLNQRGPVLLTVRMSMICGVVSGSWVLTALIGRTRVPVPSLSRTRCKYPAAASPRPRDRARPPQQRYEDLEHKGQGVAPAPPSRQAPRPARPTPTLP